jgi:phosphatidylinositol alpha-mannosyltransferase
MKIVEICPYDMTRPGGVQTHIRDLSNWLRGQGHEVMILAPKPTQDVSEPGLRYIGAARDFGFQGSHFEISLASRRDLAMIQAEMADFGADIAHIHTPWTPLMVWQVWRKLALPSVATFHATIPEQDSKTLATRLLFRTARYFMQRLDATIVPSTAPLATLSALADGQEIAVLPPSIDLTDWHKAGQDATKSTGPEVSLLYLGRLEDRKGITTLLAAWAVIAAALPKARLTIAGAGEREDAVQQALQHSDGRLQFIRQPDRQAALALAGQADIFLAPAQYGESFGLVLLEAMAAGAVPVAVANCGYATVMTGPGADLLVPPGDAGGFAAKVIGLAGDPARLQTLRDWGYAHADSYGLDQVGPHFEALFQKAINAHA